MVEDDAGAIGDNEAQMTSVTVLLWNTDNWQNDSAPFAYMNLDETVIAINDTVTFNMTSCAAPLWDEDAWEVASSWEFIDSITLDFGDDSDPVARHTEEIMTQEHKYTASGHYATSLNVTSMEGVSTTVMYTVHVLKPEVEYIGEVKNPDAFIQVTIGEPEYLDPATDYETAGGEVIRTPTRRSSGTTRRASSTSCQSSRPRSHRRERRHLRGRHELHVPHQGGRDIPRRDRPDGGGCHLLDPEGPEDTRPEWTVLDARADHDELSVVLHRSNLTTYIEDNAPPQWILDAIGETDGAYILTEDDNTAVAEASITVVDDMTVNFRLTKPFPAFLKICAYTVMSIVSKDYVEDSTAASSNGEHNDVMDETTCGTGPYMLPDEWEFGTKIHLTENDRVLGQRSGSEGCVHHNRNGREHQDPDVAGRRCGHIALSIEYESMFSDTPTTSITKGLADIRHDLRRVQHGDQHDPGSDLR